MWQPFDKQQRRRCLSSYREALRRYNELMDRGERQPPWSEAETTACAEAERHLQSAESLEREYFAELPRLAAGCCPFDGKPLYRTFDPYGFDGLWWRSDATPDEPRSCPHFCVLRGAVNLNGGQPCGGDFTAHIGPEAPYVIPRILEKPGIIAVLSKLEMTPGHIAYLIAYFAERRPPVQELAAHWPRPIFLYNQGAVLHRWRFDREHWDFDLGPWLERGKVRWCKPASRNEQLSNDPPDRCPYVNLPGRRECLELIGEHIEVAGPLAGPGHLTD